MGRFISYTNCYSNHGKTIQRKSVTETDHFPTTVPPILITIKAMVTYRGLFVLLLMLLVGCCCYIFVFSENSLDFVVLSTQEKEIFQCQRKFSLI